jgi:hypothetical protein
MNETMRKKLSPELLEMIEQQRVPDPISVIIQTDDGLQDADRQMLETVGGQLIDDLWIIKGFSARIPARALEMVVLPGRVTLVHHDGDVSA